MSAVIKAEVNSYLEQKAKVKRMVRKAKWEGMTVQVRACNGDPFDVTGAAHDGLLVHRVAAGKQSACWVVTHIPSTLRVASCYYRDDARAIAVRLAQLGLGRMTAEEARSVPGDVKTKIDAIRRDPYEL